MGAPPKFLPVKPRPRKGAYFLVYRDLAKRWRWSLKSANGKILCDSGESFPCRDDALASVRRVRRVLPPALTLAES
jgi:uncharacterized protein YegP (UPF0339 family)